MKTRSWLFGASCALALALPIGWPALGAGASDGPRWDRPARRTEVARIEKEMLGAIDPARLRAFHDMVSSEPHVASTPGDDRVAHKLADAMRKMGLDVKMQELWLYMPLPVSAQLELVSPVQRTLAIKEAPIPEDPYSSNPDLMIGWNAYSGSGEATAPVVYANYGRMEDFHRLKDLGVDVAGKIVIARYGGNFRGYKAKFAEAAGAAGLIIYTDPEDASYVRGLMYPDGGWASPDEIQRGSILTLPWTGDPLTPFIPATKDAKRLDPKDIALPKIPVQPVGWAAAQEILSRMNGPVVPEKWQGGLPFNYHLTSGAGGPVVRIKVKQDRQIRRTWNVTGTLRGSTHPEQTVIVGCHHDAWSFGAADPNSGTMVLLEAARVLSEQAAKGHRPARSIIFANWGAEEFGIFGSSEWVEAHRRELLSSAVAYLNLDAAVMGPDFGASAAPSLKTVIADAARDVQSVNDTDETVYTQWRKRSGDHADSPRFGNLGGGSDHIGFYSHAGVPSASLGAHGASGTSYHSAFDDLHWWRQTVGEDYEPARMVTRVTTLIAWRLADEDAIPLDIARYAPDTRRHVKAIAERAKELGVSFRPAPILDACDRLETTTNDASARLAAAIESGALGKDELGKINTLLLTMERVWLYEPGLPDRPWYKNLYAASDPTSGYAAWMLPALRQAVEDQDAAAVSSAAALYVRTLDRVGVVAHDIVALLPEPDQQ